MKIALIVGNGQSTKLLYESCAINICSTHSNPLKYVCTALTIDEKPIYVKS